MNVSWFVLGVVLLALGLFYIRRGLERWDQPHQTPSQRAIGLGCSAVSVLAFLVLGIVCVGMALNIIGD